MVIFQSSMHLKVAFLFAALFLVQVVYFASKKYSLLLNLDYLIISSTMKPAFVIPEYLNRSSYLTKLNVVLHHIPDYLNEVNCSGVLLGNEVAISKAESWVFNTSSDWMQDVRTANDKCEKIKSLFGFADKPMSQEEEEFPLAYGLVVHHVPTQVYFMLSAIYQLQNQFCIAVDDGAKKEFKDQMDLLDECFPNIHVKYVNKVEWFKFSVLRAVYGCVKHLTMLKSDWKYYQYLSGVDLPLKTNLEMVRILKQLNGSFNAEVAKFQSNRLHQKNVPPPVKLWKSSLSATFSRESAEFMVRSRKVHEVYDYLKTTDCPDESFWTSIAGNPKDLPIPGGFDAHAWFDIIKQEKADLKALPTTDAPSTTPSSKLGYYISRMQTWSFGGDKCNGKFVSASCAYGVRDLPLLMAAPELVAHKFYFDVQPATYFCAYETVRKRALLGQDQEFTAEEYSKLPGPRIQAGDPIEDVTFLRIM